MENNAKTLAIVGGGASGLAAAIAAAEQARDAGMPLNVVVYERDDRVGRSILATGNGRCNFSNLDLRWGEYRNAEFVRRVLERLDYRTEGDEEFGPEAGNRSVINFFESFGLEWRAEADGRLYPMANKASVVLDVLRAAAAHLGVSEVCEREVAAIDPPHGPGKRFTLRMRDGVLERADAVIVACGGRGLEKIDVAGLPKSELQPVLGPLRVADRDRAFTRELDNIRVRCDVLLFRDNGDELSLVASQKGELMFRKYGVSGICVFDLSRYAQPGDLLSISFLQTSDRERAHDYMQSRRSELAKRYGQGLSCGDMLRGLVLPRVAEALLKAEGLREDAACTRKVCNRLTDMLVDCTLEVAGIGDPDICQVRRGGLSVDNFDSATMESLDVPGLYAAGEALDVDGPCGGYNLHWAWSSGIIAGRSSVDFVQAAKPHVNGD